MSVSGILPILLSLLLLFPVKSAAGQKVDVTSENGVTVIRNPKSPTPRPGGPSRLELTEELVIGRAGGASTYVFASLRAVGADADGFIWTLDNKDIKVRVFAPDGKLSSEFGITGQGPNEWGLPSRMFVRKDGTAVIQDTGNAKLSFCARDGRFLKEISTAKLPLSSGAVTDSRDAVYMDSWTADPEKMAVSFTLFKVGPDLKDAEPIARRDVRMLEGVDPLMPRFCYALVDEDRLIWGITSDYEFQVLDREGRPVRRVIKDFDPLPIKAAARKRMLQDFSKGSAGANVHIPDCYPPFQRFVADDEGRLYVRTYDEEPKRGIWHDVFDPEGRCVLRFALPEKETISQVRNGKMYVLIREDEAGIPLVKRYGMTWK